MLILSFSWYLLMSSTEAESGIEVIAGNKYASQPMCSQPNPFISVLKSGAFKHKDRIYNLDELMIHLEKDMAKMPSTRVTALADEGTPSKFVVALSDRIKQHFPELLLVWGLENVPNKSLKQDK